MGRIPSYKVVAGVTLLGHITGHRSNVRCERRELLCHDRDGHEPDSSNDPKESDEHEAYSSAPTKATPTQLPNDRIEQDRNQGSDYKRQQNPAHKIQEAQYQGNRQYPKRDLPASHTIIGPRLVFQSFRRAAFFWCKHGHDANLFVSKAGIKSLPVGPRDQNTLSNIAGFVALQ